MTIPVLSENSNEAQSAGAVHLKKFREQISVVCSYFW